MNAYARTYTRILVNKSDTFSKAANDRLIVTEQVYHMIWLGMLCAQNMQQML